MLFLIPSAIGCPLPLPPDERRAFFAALAQEIPADSTLTADALFGHWRMTGKPESRQRAAAEYAPLAQDPGTPEGARALVMVTALRADESEWRAVAGRLKGQPIAGYARYEVARNRGVCGGYVGFLRLSFPDDHPLAVYARMGEVISGWGWSIPTWDVALDARRLAVSQRRADLAAELDAWAVKSFAETSSEESLPDYLAQRCGEDVVCAAAQREAIQAAR